MILNYCNELRYLLVYVLESAVNLNELVVCFFLEACGQLDVVFKRDIHRFDLSRQLHTLVSCLVPFVDHSLSHFGTVVDNNSFLLYDRTFLVSGQITKFVQELHPHLFDE